MRRLRRMLLSAIGAGAAMCTVPAAIMPSVVMAEESEIPIIIHESTGGVVYSNVTGAAKQNDVVTLSVEAKEGYRFVFWDIKSSSPYEIVSGNVGSEELSIRVTGSEPVFVKAVFEDGDLYHIKEAEILGLPSTASAGDVFTVRDFGELQTRIYVERAEDGSDITEEVFDSSSNTLTMPAADIVISMDVLAPTYYSEDRVLEEVVEFETDVFAIQNDTDGIGLVQSEGVAGEEIEIVTVQPDDSSDSAVSASYKITRLSDGRDVTDYLMTDSTNTHFIMPLYDISVTTDRVSKVAAPSADEAESADTVNVIVKETEGGEIIAAETGAVKRDAKVSFLAVPSDGYRFGGWIFEDEDGDYAYLDSPDDYEKPEVTYDMSYHFESQSDLVVDAVFVKQTEYNSESVHTVDMMGKKTEVAAGEEVYIDKPDFGTSHFYVINTENGADVTKELLGVSRYGSYLDHFSMPEYDVKVAVASIASGIMAADPSNTDNLTLRTDSEANVKAEYVEYVQSGESAEGTEGAGSEAEGSAGSEKIYEEDTSSEQNQAEAPVVVSPKNTLTQESIPEANNDKTAVKAKTAEVKTTSMPEASDSEEVSLASPVRIVSNTATPAASAKRAGASTASASSVPQTGDSSQTLNWSIAAGASAAALCIAIAVKRKRV